MNGVGLQPQLRTMLGIAQRYAAGLRRGPVGPRELLLAAISTCPELVLSCARDQGIEVGRLLWALREWGPIPTVEPAIAAGSAVTPEAGGLVMEATRSAGGQACSALIKRLLDPATFDGGSTGEVAEGPAPDATALLLSRLKLI